MLKLGEKIIKSLYLGDKAIAKVFLGAKLIFNKKPYYCQIEYLESTGTQYIDTGIYLTNNHSVEIDFQLTQAVQSRTGLYGGLNSSMARHGALLSPTTNQLEGGYGLSNSYYQLGLLSTTRHTLKQEKNKLYYDGNLAYTFATATFSLDKTAPLMNFDFTNYKPAKAKYYSSKWWDGDTLVRDFIPVLDYNMKPCMYDKVSGDFFYNQGAGEFAYASQ